MNSSTMYVVCFLSCLCFRVFCIITVSSLYGEYVVSKFFLPGGVFLPSDYGLVFFISAYVRVQSTNESIMLCETRRHHISIS